MTSTMAEEFHSKVSEIEVINDRYYIPHIELVDPHRLDFDAGQYIIIKIPDTDQIRQYSICSEPEMNHAIELLIDTQPEGAGSKYFKALEVGDQISFLAPAGRFTFKSKPKSEEIIFIATGAGIAPFRSILYDQLITKQSNQKLKLLWGMRHDQDLFWEEELHQMADEYDNFSFEIILSQPSETWSLSKGYVTDLLEGLQKDFSNREFYLCGGTKMIESVREYLKTKEVDSDNIHSEKFF